MSMEDSVKNGDYEKIEALLSENLDSFHPKYKENLIQILVSNNLKLLDIVMTSNELMDMKLPGRNILTHYAAQHNYPAAITKLALSGISLTKKNMLGETLF